MLQPRQPRTILVAETKTTRMYFSSRMKRQSSREARHLPSTKLFVVSLWLQGCPLFAVRHCFSACANAFNIGHRDSCPVCLAGRCCFFHKSCKDSLVLLVEQENRVGETMDMNDDDLSFLENAAANHGDVELVAPPAPPLSFEPAPRGRAERVDALVLNPSSGDVMEVQNIIYERHPDGTPPPRAYWVGRKLRKCIFGVVKECTVLSFRNDMNVPWQVTQARAAVKIMSWEKIHQLQHIEDPIKEVAAMQHVSKDGVHQHVMGVLDVLEDEEYLLMFMPFASSGDLFGFVQTAGRFEEPMARHWFKQILSVSFGWLMKTRSPVSVSLLTLWC